MEKQKQTLEPIVVSYKSKVIWTAITSIAVVFVSDDFKDWWKHNPELAVVGQAVVAIVLRAYTSGKLKWKHSSKS